MNKYKICFVTGTRAEYGLLRFLMKEVSIEKKFKLQLVVTGSHLSKSHGNTYREIINDGFQIDAKCKILTNKDKMLDIAKAMGKAIPLFASAFKNLKPDIVVMLGDRYELFSAASCCNIMQIPIAHIHGGETTEGAFDEAIRHSITKMSHIHFVAHQDYMRRVRQLGEDPKTIFNVGGLGVDNLFKMKLFNSPELCKSLNIKFNKKNILVTYHPVTLGNFNEKEAMKNILFVLSKLENTNIFFTMPNADTNNKIIFNMIKNFCKKDNNSYYFNSLGQRRYYSILRYVDVVLGNSSSGILEVPSFKKATINIGDRQKGRIQAKSIINCSTEVNDIKRAIKRVYSKKFRENLSEITNPFGPRGAAKKIVKILKDIRPKNMQKHFHDLK